MHIEKNVFDNIFYTVMDVKGKMKDNLKTRVDMKKTCKHPLLELVEVLSEKFLKLKVEDSFFDSMEHLVIHLAHETRMGGLVQYRWMYPFERYMHSLKKKVKNKA